MSSQSNDQPNETPIERAQNGTPPLPRWWGSWSARERELWPKWYAADQQWRVLIRRLDERLSGEELQLATDCIEALSEQYIIAEGLSEARLERYLPYLADLIHHVFDSDSEC
jgi:hypothetical protein